MRLNDHLKALAAIFAVQIFWGIAGPLVKIVLGSVPPFSLLFLRCLFTSLILFLLLEKNYLRKQPKMSRLDKRDIFLAGFLGVFINIALYFWGQAKTTVIDAWVITSTSTVFVVLYCYFFLHERLGKTVYLGIGLAFLGTLLVIGSPILDFGKGGIAGNIAMLGATLAGVASFLITKRLVERHHALVLTYYFFLISLFFSLPLFLWEFWQNPLWIANLPTSSLFIIAYLVIFSSILAYSFQNYALIRLPATIASTVGYTSSVIAITLSIIFLHEQPTKLFIIGAAIVTIGLFLAESRHPKHPIHKLRR